MGVRTFAALSVVVAGAVTGGAVPAAAVTTPAYYPAGPQAGIDESVVVAGGWSVCYSGGYHEIARLSTILAACDLPYLLLASGPASSTVFDVLAAAPRDDVLLDVDLSNTGHEANGTQWYFDTESSWGFAPAGATLVRNTCDYGDSPNGDFADTPDPLRLCWHTSGNMLRSGWRSGTHNFLATADYRRVIFESDGVAPNQAPVCTGAAPSVAVVAPPNGRFHGVTINGVTDGDGDPVTLTVEGIRQDEAVEAGGPDGTGVGTGTAAVRAERSGRGNGRVYHVAFTADDGRGGTCSGSVQVAVPHHPRSTAVDDGPAHDSTIG